MTAKKYTEAKVVFEANLSLDDAFQHGLVRAQVSMANKQHCTVEYIFHVYHQHVYANQTYIYSQIYTCILQYTHYTTSLLSFLYADPVKN